MERRQEFGLSPTDEALVTVQTWALWLTEVARRILPHLGQLWPARPRCLGEDFESTVRVAAHRRRAATELPFECRPPIPARHHVLLHRSPATANSPPDARPCQHTAQPKV